MAETISVNLTSTPILSPEMDNRFDQVQQLLLKFTKMEFGDRLPVSDKGDDLDAVIAGLNTLGEELEKKSLLTNDTNDRVNAILDVALKHTLMDFSVKAPVSTKGDELDAIAVGLNTLSEELEERIKALEESARKLESVNKELEAFSYSVSHDLRAPLRAVDGYAKMIEEDYSNQLDEEGRRMIRMMQYNAKKMGTLIDDLLAFSRLGRKDIQKSPIDMDELVAGALSEVSKSIDHRADIKIGKLHPIAGDYGLMNQVFVNLISNAIKYSSRAESPRVWISSEKKRQGSDLHHYRQWRWFRYEVRRQVVRRFPAAPQYGGVRRHRRGPGHRTAHCEQARRQGLGRREKERRSILSCVTSN